MAFDKTDQADLDALATEVFTDPIAMGYNPSSTGDTLNKLNDPAANVGGDTAGAVLTVELLYDAVAADPGSLAPGGQFSEGEFNFVSSFLSQPLTGREGDTIIEPWRAAISTALTGTGAIKTTLDGQTQALSRAEVLFGLDTVITRDDWLTARDNGVVT